MNVPNARHRGLLLLVACAVALAVTAVALAWPERKPAPPCKRQPTPKTMPREPQPEQLLPGGGAPGVFSPA